MSHTTEETYIQNPSTGRGCCGGTLETDRTDQVKIKKDVRDYYAAAVTARGGKCYGRTDETATRFSGLAGYPTEALAAVPPAAVEKSFGCGDPLAFAEVKPGETVLDIGSGAGIDCFLAAEKVGPTGRVIGLDMTAAMLETARRNAEQGGYTNVEFRKGEAEDMPVSANSVDWVISNCVINLSPEKEKVFAEIHRVLKPGGRISISDIVAEALPDFVKADPASYCSCIGGAIPEAEYLRLIRRAGLVEVAVESRLQYSPEMIKGFIAANDQLQERYGALLEANPAVMEPINIASIKVSGRKPLP